MEINETDKIVSVKMLETRDRWFGVSYADLIDGVYVLPTMAGEFVIRCQILCNEYADVIEQEIKVVVE